MFVSMAEWILLYIFNVKVNDKKEVFGKVELDNYVQQNKLHNEDVSSEVNKELFSTEEVRDNAYLFLLFSYIRSLG